LVSNAIVIGASMTGLLAARELSDFYAVVSAMLLRSRIFRAKACRRAAMRMAYFDRK
jgi:hypothetical protein